ncbi:MAG: YicC/YloC family endoribonuclease [Pseudomonadota bacterium]
MPKSMTAFVTQKYNHEHYELIWELHSVNHRYLEVKFHVPEVFSDLEPELRKQLKARLHRGKITCRLHYHPSIGATSEIQINSKRLENLAALRQQIMTVMPDIASGSVTELLNFPGTLIANGTDYTDSKKHALDLFEQSLTGLIEIREREGADISKVLQQRVDLIEVELAKIHQMRPSIINKQKEKLEQRLESIKADIDESRISQEIVFHLQKLDVAEELDRLQIHCDEIKRLLRQAAVIGRRLDFLLQECNREANTLAAKSADADSTHAGINIKVTIEEMREQAQNIE